MLGLHLYDWLVLAAYFGVVIYLGVFVGSKRTKTMGDFFVAGGRWGPLVSFIFVFASALAGNEAVVISGKAYTIGLAGVWVWWAYLFATPIYFLFSTYYRRARVYNLAEFLEMRYGTGVAALYSLIAGALYGVLFAILVPGLEDPELARGTVLENVLPVGAVGLLIASFFAAAMSSAATYATTSSAMMIDYCSRKVMFPGRSRATYLTMARAWAAFSVLLAACTTLLISEIVDYVNYTLSLLCFLGIPIYFSAWSGVAPTRPACGARWCSVADPSWSCSRSRER